MAGAGVTVGAGAVRWNRPSRAKVVMLLALVRKMVVLCVVMCVLGRRALSKGALRAEGPWFTSICTAHATPIRRCIKEVCWQ